METASHASVGLNKAGDVGLQQLGILCLCVEVEFT